MREEFSAYTKLDNQTDVACTNDATNEDGNVEQRVAAHRSDTLNNSEGGGDDMLAMFGDEDDDSEEEGEEEEGKVEPPKKRLKTREARKRGKIMSLAC